MRLQSVPGQVAVQATSVLVDAILDVRAEQCVEAIHRLDASWRTLESSLSARALRPLRVVRAFAEVRSANVREAAVAETAARGLAPAERHEFELLAAEWPAMRTFLETYDLA